MTHQPEKVTFNKRVLYLIQQAGSLMLMPRSHVRSLGNSFDTIASHSNQASIIAYCVARMENLSHQEGLTALSMAAMHDLAEARTGDLDFIAKNYCTDDEEKAVNDQFKGLDFSKDLINLVTEYEERNSKISECAKDADSLAQLFMEWHLMWQGNNLARKWFDGDFVNRVPNFYTKSAREIAYLMKDSNPNEWWSSQLVSKKGKVKNLKHLMGKGYKSKYSK